MDGRSTLVSAVWGRLRTWLTGVHENARDIRDAVREDPAAVANSPVVKIGIWIVIALTGLIAVQWFLAAVTPKPANFGNDQPTPYSTLYVACTNLDCLAAYTSQQKMTFTGWPLKCDKCGQKSIYRARRCGTCREWFAKASGPPTESSPCPLCARKRAAEVKTVEEKKKANNPDDEEDGW